MTNASIGNGVTTIGNEAFLNCDKLAKVRIGDDVKTIGYRAFYNCTDLIDINLTDRISTFGDLYGVSETFRGCIKLTSVVLGRRVSEMGSSVFVNCTGLKKVDIHEGCSLIGKTCFNGCTNLEAINIPESVTIVDESAFKGCTNMKTAIIGDGVITIGMTAFENCEALESATLGRNLKTVGYRAFNGCTSLKEISIPDYVTTFADLYGVGQQFYGCKNLAKVTLGKRITNMGSEAFASCTNIQQIIINDGCSNIASKCFNGCNAIQTITNYCVELPKTASDAFSSYTAALYVPEASLNLYKTTEPWSKFGTIGTIESGVPEPQNGKVATPTIAYNMGKIQFACETEGAEFVSEVKVDDAQKSNSAEITLTQVYVITVYATASGKESSDVATAKIGWRNGTPFMEGFDSVTLEDGPVKGDVNEDGTVDVADISNIISIMAENARLQLEYEKETE
jgi:hypothetical protein